MAETKLVNGARVPVTPEDIASAAELKPLIDAKNVEIAQEQELSKLNQALLLLAEANTELAFWVDKTPEQITQLIADQPTSFVGFKQLHEQQAQALAVMAKILKLLRDIGVFNR